MESCMATSSAAALSSTPTSIFSQLLHVLLVSQCTLSKNEDYPMDRTEEILASGMKFDFVIAGAGTAGTILAHRLTEVPDWNVLLIEAGEDPVAETDVPGLMLFLFGEIQDYAYKVELQEGVCQGMNNKRCRWSKGKALGGSSVINAMLHVFGNDRDYNEWANMGNTGWSYEEVLPYFRKSMNCPHDFVKKWGSKYFGTGGPMNLRNYNYTMTNMQEVILDAARELGLNVLEPLIGDRFVGYGKSLGPKKHLEDMGIPVLTDLPVGKNLQDHIVWLGMHIGYLNESVAPVPPTYAMDITYEYLVHKSGELASVGIDLLGFINVADPNPKYPDIEIDFGHFPRWNMFKIGTLLKGFDVEETLIHEIFKKNMDMDLIIPCTILLKPKSRGKLELRSIDPADPVKIYANYFTEEEDMKTLLKTTNQIKSMLKTETMKKYGMSLQHFDIPGCRHTKPDSDAYWECSARHLAASLFHAVGTAKMGPAGDPTAVVDPRLKVHGIERLRVIDASIMPNITSGNTNAPTMMIAEKGADMIKEDWKKKVTRQEL
ncbi:Glucose dehydrogenase [FAD, quinone] [Anthophora quadrimaculata]